MTNILIRMPNWLGDIVMAASVIDALHRSGRYALHLLIRPPWGDLFSHDPRVAGIIDCRDAWQEMISTARSIRQIRFEAAVDLTHSCRSRILLALSGIPRIFREIPTAPGAHQILRYLSVVRPLVDGLPDVPWPPQVFAPPDDVPSGARHPGPEILIFPAAAYGPAKMWSIERYAGLLSRMADRGWLVRLIGTDSDRPFLNELIEQSIPDPTCGRVSRKFPSVIPDPTRGRVPRGFPSVIPDQTRGRVPRGFPSVIPDQTRGRVPRGFPSVKIEMTSGLPLAKLMCQIAGSSAVISCDSGAAHLAAALGKPTVALFFSTDPSRTAPLGPAVRIISAAVPCRPCFLRTCPIGYLCRDAITPDDVMAHLVDIFDVPAEPRSINTNIY